MVVRNGTAISETNGIIFTTNWRNYFVSRGLSFPEGDHILRGFRIRKEDLTQLMAVPGMAHARAYLAMKTIDGLQSLDILLVPVDEDGKDIIVPVKETDEIEEGDLVSIFDFTVPCPVQCDNESPLYGPRFV